MGMIYEVRGESHSDHRVIAYGARRTRLEAEALLRERKQRVQSVGGKIDRWWVEEIDTTGLFEIPSRPTPRERYAFRADSYQPAKGWQACHVEILDQGVVVGSYDRNYAMLDTFEPFRQADRHFALVAPDYTATSVLDLQTGQIIASELAGPDGFCPVGFYVPDWWDTHDGSILPGSMHWSDEYEWPSRGDFGFVWGCYWGDDSSWKVQYLDLSEVRQGKIRREERFGYLRLATRPGAAGRDFIRVTSWKGQKKVEFAVLRTFDLATGEAADLNPFD